MTKSSRLYMTHYNRGESYCPLCYASIVWRKVGEHKYCPCDRIPVLCIRDSGTNFRVVKNGEIISGVKILTPENAATEIGRSFPDGYVFDEENIRVNTLDETASIP